MDDKQFTKYLAELIDLAIENAKKQGKISSAYSRITYDELGKPLVDGIQIAINDSKNEALDTFNKLLKELTYKRDFMLMDESEYYSQLEYLRDNYLIKGSSDWWKYTAQIIEYEQSLTLSEQEEAQLRQEILDKSLAATEKYYKSVTEAQTKYASKLKDYGDQFFAVRNVFVSDKTDAVEAKAVLTNYEAYTNRIKKYQQEMEELKARGIVPQDLLNEIASMDVEEAMEYVTLLNDTSDEALKKYIADRDEYIKLCESVAAETIGYQASPEALDTFTKTMESIFEKAGLVLPENFYNLGETGASDFGEGFMGGLKIIEEQITQGFTEGFKSSLEDAARVISDTYAQFSFDIGSQLGSNVTNNINNSFTVGTVKQSSAEQISAWRSAQNLERLRGIL